MRFLKNAYKCFRKTTVGNPTLPKLLVFGHPLLDVTVQIKDDELLREYKLERNGQKEVPFKELSNIIGDATARYKVLKVSLGGSGLNTSRILAAMGQRDILFFGGVGGDQNGRIVKEILKRSLVNACLQEFKEIETGICLALCFGIERSLTAHIGAASKIEKAFVENNMKPLKADPLFYYIEGFFIPGKMDIVRFLYKKFSKNPKVKLMVNLNAPYIVKTFQTDVAWFVKKADFVFGNREEFEELARINGFETLEDLLVELLADFKSKTLKVIVVTDGANPVFFYEGNSSNIALGSVIVPRVDSAEIVDTTGAGDGFVAGFIYGLLKGLSTRECIELGCGISSKVIKELGCNLPNEFEAENSPFV